MKHPIWRLPTQKILRPLSATLVVVYSVTCLQLPAATAGVPAPTANETRARDATKAPARAEPESSRATTTSPRWQEARRAMQRVAERRRRGEEPAADIAAVAARLREARELLTSIHRRATRGESITRRTTMLARVGKALRADEAAVVSRCDTIRAELARAGLGDRIARVDEFVRDFQADTKALRDTALRMSRKARSGESVVTEAAEALARVSPDHALRHGIIVREETAPAPPESTTREAIALDAAGNAPAGALPAAPFAAGPLASEPPLPDDLGETPEVQITQEIRDLAASLGNSPVRIYEYVRNGFAFEPYFGSLKGSQAALETGAGNDYDLASLLIALLRAAGIPARYARGTVDVPIDRVQDWLGLTNPVVANALLNTAGIAAVPLVDATNTIVAYRVDRLWVRAYVPFGNYRGVANTAGSYQWVPLDPAFKTHAFQTGIVGVPDSVAFDEATYFAEVQSELTFEFYGEQVRDFLLTGLPGKAISDIPYAGTVIPEEFGILPASLPYELVASGGEASVLPDFLRHSIGVTIDDGFSFLLLQELLLPEVILARRTVSWVPATPADQAVVDSYGGLANTPPFLVDVKPQLKVDGVVQAEGSAVPLGSATALTINFVAPETGMVDSPFHRMIAGDYAAIGLDGFQISNRLLIERAGKLLDANALVGTPAEDEDDLVGELLNIAGILYFLREREGTRAVADVFRFQNVRGISEGLTGSNLDVVYLFDRPFAVTPGNQVLDVQRGQTGALFSVDGDGILAPPLRRITGINGSAQEHAMWEELIAVESISTIKALQLAHEHAIPVHTITQANQNDVIPCYAGGGTGTVYQCMSRAACGVGFAVPTVQNEVSSGLTVEIPECLVALNQWRGTGYIASNPATNGAKYIIFGGLASNGDFGLREVGSATTALGTADSFVPVDQEKGQKAAAGLPTERIDATNVDEALGRLLLPSAVENRIRQLVAAGFVVTASEVVLEIDGREGLLLRVDASGGKAQFLFFDLLAGGAGTESNPQEGPPCGQNTTCNENKGECRDPCTCTGGQVAVVNGNTLERFDDVTIRNAGLPIRLQRAYSSRATGQCGVNGRCRGGTNGEETCVEDAECPVPFFGACQKECFDDVECGRCAGGSNGDESCALDADCPDSHPGACHADQCTTGPFGFGWTHTYNVSLVEHANGYVTLFNEDGGQFLFTKNPDDSYNAPLGLYWTLTKLPLGFTVRKKDGTTLFFTTAGVLERMQDRNGNEQTLAYNPNGTLHTVTDSVRGVALTFVYNAQKHVETVTDLAGRTWSYGYEAANPNRLASATTPSDAQTPAATTSYAYFDNPATRHNLKSITDPRGNIRSFLYYTNDSVFRETDEVGASRSFVYNPSKHETRVINGRGFEQVFVNDDTGRATRIQFPDGTDVRFTWDAQGNRRSVTNQAGYTTHFEYDSRGNLTRSIDALVHATSFTYGSCVGAGNQGEPCNQDNQCPDSFADACAPQPFNQVTSITDPKANPPTRIDYDLDGNPVTITDAAGTVTEMAYDEPARNPSAAHGLVTRITRAKSLPEESTGTFEYDSVGRVSRITDPRGALTPDPADFVTSLQYDARANVSTSTDALGRATDFAYDLRDRLVRVTDAAQPVRGTTRYGYDLNGNLVAATDARSSTTTFEYDTRNRLSKTTDQLGQPPNDPTGHAETLEYDANGNLVTKIDRNGQHLGLEYDALDRVTRKILPGNLVTTFDYDPAGNLTSVLDPDSLLTMTYDAMRKLATVSTAGSPNQANVLLIYSYDADGNRATMVDPTGSTMYSYDSLNRMRSITTPSSQSVHFDYDSLNRRKQTTIPNGTSTDFTYDVANQLRSRTNKHGATVLSSFEYAYDGVGNRSALTQQRSATTVASSLTYVYDALNRLTQATRPLPGNPAETFIYDSVGNRLTRDGQTMGALFDAANRLREDEEFCYEYDHNGNETTKTAKVFGACTGAMTRYTYNADNQLIRVDPSTGEVAEYRYDGLGRRFAKKIGNQITRYTYDNEDILLEFDGSNTLLAHYTHGPGIDEPLIIDRDLNANGSFDTNERFFYHADGIGSSTDLVDAAAAIAKSYVYDSFGQMAQQIGNLPAPYAYSGREFDPESNLSYYRARYYDSTTGRFMQEDPLGSINSYTYVGGNPINHIDPYGLITFQVGITVNFQIGPINVNFTSGVVVDSHGNVGTYTVGGGGIGAGANAFGGVNFGLSSGECIQDIGGPFLNESGQLEAIAGGGVDVFAGQGSHGQPVVGGGFSLGVGGGADYAVGGSQTQVTPLWVH